MHVAVADFLRETAYVHNVFREATADACLPSWPLVIRFLIPHMLIDIETHHLRSIHDAYQGLAFLEGKIGLSHLGGCVYDLGSSPILAIQGGQRRL
jgi:hypothetical protein